MSKREILVVGSVAFDSLETPHGHRDECLGGSATYSSVTASAFADVSLVAVVGDDFPDAHTHMLRSRGINLDGLEIVEGGKTFRWKGRYGENLNEAQTLETHLNVFEQFDPQIPEAHRKKELLFLGNIDPVLQLKVLDQVDHPHLVAMDTMNFWITSKRDELVNVLSRIDLLIINDGEARQLSGESNILRAADRIRAMGPKMLIIKRGEYGAMLFHPEGIFCAPAVPLRDVLDPTGAGDTFAGGLMGALAKSEELDFNAFKRGVLTGTVMASFTVEGFSLERLLSLQDDELDARLAQLKGMMQVD
ncbi:MAG: PfkB family carbohydrate kinase [Bradymonadia bacterium]